MEENDYTTDRGQFDDETRASLSRGEIDALRRVGVNLTPSEIPDLRQIDPTCRMERASRGLHETAAHLCVLPSTLRKRIQARRLLGFWSEADKCWKLPEIQFHRGWPLDGLEQLLKAMPVQILPAEIYGFLTTPRLDLKGEDSRALTPIEWLREGRDRSAVIGIIET